MNSTQNPTSRTRELSKQRLPVDVWFLCALLDWPGPAECGAGEAGFYRVVSAQPTHISSLDTGGMLVWSNAVTNAVCRIASLPSPSAPMAAATFTAPITCTGKLMSVRMPLRPEPCPVVLSINSDGWGTVMETRAVPCGQATTISINESNPYTHPPMYYAYARADDRYTRIYVFTNGASVVVDLDAVPEEPSLMTGTIIGRQYYFCPHYLATNSISVTGPTGPLPPILTDQEGRYWLTNAGLGKYTLGFTYQNVAFSFGVTNSAGTVHRDYLFYDPMQLMEPNIYLYPQTPTSVEVVLAIPNGGYISASDPPYNGGWQVSVDTNGVINGQYDYLFYEAFVSCPMDAAAGWLLDGTDLEAGFRDLLSQLGLVGREIDDFVEHWVPIMEGAPWYAVYLQDANSASTFCITPQPQSVLRAHFVVRPLEQPITIAAPTVTPFVREGFTVVEWGVLGWGE